MNDQTDVARIAYAGIAALAGAITALSFMPWKAMRWTEIAMTIVVGSAFATFAVPYLAGTVGGVDLTEMRALCFFTYIGATGANAFIPKIIRGITRWIDRVFPGEEIEP